MDERIKEAIDSFSDKLEEAYKEGEIIYPNICNDIVRKFAGTDIDFHDFWEKYHHSKYYRDDIDINLKVVSALQDVVIEAFFLWNCEMFFPLYSQGGVFSEFVRLNREQSIIVKTRIYWERIMNFCYLLIEGKELETKNSKKKKFKRWAEEHRFVFLEDILELIEQYDNAYRSPEVHKFSRIRSAVVSGKEFSAQEYATVVMNLFGINVYPNMLLILQGETHFIRTWTKVEGQLTAFNEVPDWAKEQAAKMGLKPEEVSFFSGSN